MASSAAPTLASLLQGTNLIDPDEVVSASNDALKRSNDISVQHAKAIALLNLDRYDDTCRIFEEVGDALKRRAPLAWCYTLYKCGRLQDAVNAAKDDSVGRGSKHVEAQAAYRLEDFQRAAELYEQLSVASTAQDSEYNDLRINIGATDAQLAWSSQAQLMRKPKVGREDLEQFETTFNAACGYIANGDLKQAEVLLNRAKDLCNEADELSIAEKNAELLPIKVQQLYVLSRLGRRTETERLCVDIDVASMSEATERYIAQANLIASASTTNPYITQRLFHSTSVARTQNPPFKFQSRILKRNALVSDLLAGKMASVIKASSPSSAIIDTSADTTSAGILNAAAHAHNQTGKGALAELQSLLGKRPNDAGLLLTITQLHLLTNNLSTATSLLESTFAKLETSRIPTDLDVRFNPSLLAVLVALYNKTSRHNRSKMELIKAAEYWQKRSIDIPPSVRLLNEAGTALLSSASGMELREAQHMFQSVHSLHPMDRSAAAGLLASTTVISEDNKNLQKKLPSMEKLVAGIDAQNLEEIGILRPRVVSLGDQARKRPAHESDVRQAKAKKSRKNKPSKSFDPSKNADPERWLPFRDRSNWKPKGRKNKARAGLSTQGGVVNEDSRPVTPSSQVLQQIKPGGAAKSKKKKSKGAR